jgi:cyclopropane fatty-acyl-phospholipid synthase-like methyltransferase
VLRASRRLLRPRGRTAFFTIHPTPGLSPHLRRRAHRDGPVAVASHLSGRELLERAGFVDVEETDCTSEFVTVAQAWVEQFEGHRDVLAEVLGADEFDERQTERRIQLQAVRDGLLRRSLLVATRGDDR